MLNTAKFLGIFGRGTTARRHAIVGSTTRRDDTVPDRRPSAPSGRSDPHIQKHTRITGLARSTLMVRTLKFRALKEGHIQQLSGKAESAGSLSDRLEQPVNQ